MACMRWDSMRVSPEGESTTPSDALFARPAVVRTFDSPQFAGMTFYEVHAKSILNRVNGELQSVLNKQ